MPNIYGHTSSTGLHNLLEIYPSSPRATMPLGLQVNDLVFDAAADGNVEGIQNLYLDPRAEAAGVRIGPVVFAHNVLPVDDSGRIVGPATAAQVHAAFENLDRLLEVAGSSRSQILRIAGFHRDLGEKDLLNQAMVERFPDPAQKPVHKYVPASLPTGVNFMLQALIVDAGERRIIEMEGVRHNDPISLGAIAGCVLVSSRVQGRLEAGARSQAARLIDRHIRAVVEHAGGRLEDVTQTVWGIGDPAFAPVVEEECRRAWPHPASRPDVRIILAGFPHSPLPRVEFTALLGRSS